MGGSDLPALGGPQLLPRDWAGSPSHRARRLQVCRGDRPAASGPIASALPPDAGQPGEFRTTCQAAPRAGDRTQGVCSAQGGEVSVQSPGPCCVVRKHAGWSRSLGPAGGRARSLQAGVQGELQNKGTRFPLSTWADLHPPVLGAPEMGLVLPCLVYYLALGSPGGKSASRSSGAHFIDLETEEQRGRTTPRRAHILTWPHMPSCLWRKAAGHQLPLHPRSWSWGVCDCGG